MKPLRQRVFGVLAVLGFFALIASECAAHPGSGFTISSRTRVARAATQDNTTPDKTTPQTTTPQTTPPIESADMQTASTELTKDITEMNQTKSYDDYDLIDKEDTIKILRAAIDKLNEQLLRRETQELIRLRELNEKFDLVVAEVDPTMVVLDVCKVFAHIAKTGILAVNYTMTGILEAMIRRQKNMAEMLAKLV